jgi:hypothetical protein
VRVKAIGEAPAAVNEAEAGLAESRPFSPTPAMPAVSLPGWAARGQTLWHWLFVGWLWVDGARPR